MINKTEIEAKSQELEIHPSNVQRDYVFSWFLSGITQSDNDLKNILILKGGNCFRKAYFEYARFSNDLDFSTQTELDPRILHTEINKACEYIGSKTGISFAVDKNIVIPKKLADDESKYYEARVYFKGFYGEENYFIKIKLDVKEFDRIYLPIQSRKIIHNYSDYENCAGEISCMKLEELLASKLKALLQRRHSPDLYDFIYAIFFQNTFQIDRLEVVKTFLKKTIYEPNPTIAKNLLLELPFQVFKSFWQQYLICPKQSLINFNEAETKYKLAISELFGLIRPETAYSYSGAGYGANQNLNYFPADYRNIIMEAGRQHKILRMMYDGLERQIEPYSLAYKIRVDGVGREYLYGWDRTGGRSGKMSIKNYTQDKIQSLNMTEEKFEPRMPIELSKAGEQFGQKYFSKLPPYLHNIRAKRRKTGFPRTRSFHSPAVFLYTLQCPICMKKFKRIKSYNTKLNRHKDKFGNRCYGSHGYFI